MIVWQALRVRDSAFKCKYSNEVWKAAAREKDRKKVKESVKQGFKGGLRPPAFGLPTAAINEAFTYFSKVA